MRKSLFLGLALTFCTLGVQAIRPERIPITMKQSDGTTIKVYRNGESYCAFFTTEDGKVVYPNSKGDLCYASLVNGQIAASSVVAHEAAERTASELAFLSNDTITPATPSLRRLTRREAPMKLHYASTSDGLGQYGKSALGAVSSLGNLTVPVILVAYSDVDFQQGHDVEKYTRYLNKEGYSEESVEVGSVKDYFKAQSNGLFVPSFDVVAKVTLDSARAYYGGNRNGTAGRDKNVVTMIKEAVQKAIDEHQADFSKYVVDGSIPNVMVIYAGQGEATGGPAESVWPHELDFDTTISGYRFKSYFVGNELYSGNQLMGMGVLCHEFGHALGLPDFYATDYNYTDQNSFGVWSIMDMGAYFNGTYAPIGYTAYEKSYMGWLSIPELTDDQAVTLTDPNQGESTQAALIRNPFNSKEYLILENRQTGTWTPASLPTGMMVTHVKYDMMKWAFNTVNNDENNMGAFIQTADGLPNIGGATKDMLYGNGTANFSAFAGTMSEKKVYKVIKHSNKTVTLLYNDPHQAEDFKVENGQWYEKVTDVATLQSNDTLIMVNEDARLALSTVYNDSTRCGVQVDLSHNGWAYADADAQMFKLRKLRSDLVFDKVNGQGGYLAATRHGLGSTGSIDATSRATVTITDGNMDLIFKSSYSRNSLSYDAANYCFKLVADSPTQVQLYRLSHRTPTGIAGVHMSKESKGSDAIYNLNGQRVSKNQLQRGIYIINGKKVLVK